MTDVLPDLEPLALPASLAVDALYTRCNDTELPFDSTDELEPLVYGLKAER